MQNAARHFTQHEPRIFRSTLRSEHWAGFKERMECGGEFEEILRQKVIEDERATAVQEFREREEIATDTIELTDE